MADRRAVPLAELAPRGGKPLGRLGDNVWPEPLPAHVGLWLDRVVALGNGKGRGGGSDEEGGKGNPERLRLYQVAVESLRPGTTPAADPPAVAAYRPLFDRWRRRLEEASPGLVRRVVAIEARTRLLLHPATHETVTEGTVLLHHTYGVPYLPGSGLKGVLRRRLCAAWPEGEGDERANEILGRQDVMKGDLASAVDVLDALWVPERPPDVSPEWSPLALDVVTPHHPEYMTDSGKGRKRPTDSDEPVPVHRLTVAPGARFLLVLEAAEAAVETDWLEILLHGHLLPALEEDGFGAWTSIGYGRLGAVGAGASGARSEPAGRPAAAAKPETELPPEPAAWFPALVVRDAGTGRLTAALEDGRKAEATQAEKGELLESLPAGPRGKLEGKKKQARLEVQVEALGASWRIVGLRVLGGRA